MLAVLDGGRGHTVGDGQNRGAAGKGIFGDAAQRVIVLRKGDKDDQILRGQLFERVFRILQIVQID